MQKRILSFIICFCMLLGTLALASCGDGSGLVATTKTPTTVNILAITQETTTPEAVAAVQKAINEITEARYKTHVIFTFVTEDNYMAKVNELVQEAETQKILTAISAAQTKLQLQEASAAAILAAKHESNKHGSWVSGNPSNDNKSEETTTATGGVEETITNEIGRIEVVYPKTSTSPIDLIYIQGKDMYDEFVERGLLKNLFADIKGSSANFTSLTKIINPYLLDSVVTGNNELYAISNNHLVANYTYLALNKALCEKYGIDPETINSYADCEEFLQMVKEGEENVTPFLGEPKPLGIHYAFGEDVAIGTYFDPIHGADLDKCEVKNLFEIPEYVDHLTLVSKYKEAGYFENAGESFAVAAIEGDKSIETQYADEYYLKVVQMPFVNEATPYDGMYGISSYSTDVAKTRCLELIYLFNSDAEARNLLQYGIYETNYTFDRNGVLSYINDTYRMDQIVTFNQFIGYADEGVSPDIWEYQKQTNIDASLAPFMKFVYNYATLEKDTQNILLTAAEDIMYAAIGITREVYESASPDAQFEYVKQIRTAYMEQMIEYVKESGVYPNKDDEQLKEIIELEKEFPKEKLLTMAKEIISEEYFADIKTDKEIDEIVKEYIVEALEIKNYEVFEKAFDNAKNYVTYITQLKTYYEKDLIDAGYDKAEISGMSGDETVNAIFAIVKEKCNKKGLTAEQLDKAAKDIIAATYTSNTGDVQGWDDIEKLAKKAEDYAEIVKKMRKVYDSKLLSTYSQATLDKMSDVKYGECVVEMLRLEYMANNSLDDAALSSLIYEKMAQKIDAANWAEIDAVKNQPSKYNSYITKLKSAYKSALKTRYTSTEIDALAAVDTVSFIYNYLLQETCGINDRISNDIDVSTSKYASALKDAQIYANIISCLKTYYNTGLQSKYTAAQINDLNNVDTVAAIIEIVVNEDYYTIEMLRGIGCSLASFNNSKRTIKNYVNYSEKLKEVYGELINKYYTAEEQEAFGEFDYEAVAIDVIKKEYCSNYKTVAEIIVDACEEPIANLPETGDIAGYCAEAAAELNKNNVFFAVISAMNKAFAPVEE